VNNKWTGFALTAVGVIAIGKMKSGQQMDSPTSKYEDPDIQNLKGNNTDISDTDNKNIQCFCQQC
jgi:hypothetical protein